MPGKKKDYSAMSEDGLVKEVLALNKKQERK